MAFRTAFADYQGPFMNNRRKTALTTFTVTTDAFAPGGPIPPEYTCSGRNESPALQWTGVPAGARSLAVICEDPDAPSGTFTHWILYNIMPERTGLPRGIPKKPVLDTGSRHGQNSFGRMEYGGPCPPPGKPHRYYFRVHALDTWLTLRAPANRAVIDQAMKDHVLATAEVMGTFSR